MIHVKICGLTSEIAARQAVLAGARSIGLVFFKKSPRFVKIEKARAIAVSLPVGVMKVGLFVDMDDAGLGAVLREVPLDMLQLHGQESPERVAEIKARFGLPIMKAIGVAQAADLEKLSAFDVANQFLLDAKPPKDAVLPGGNGLRFDWRILANAQINKPWMLAGGLNPENVAEAIALTGANQVDVSSGVESAPGVKDKGLMEAFVQAARA